MDGSHLFSYREERIPQDKIKRVWYKMRLKHRLIFRKITPLPGHYTDRVFATPLLYKWEPFTVLDTHLAESR